MNIENPQLASAGGVCRVLVIGNGMVGHHFAQSLRKRDDKNLFHVTIVGEESHPAYDRVGMSGYLRGKSVADLALDFAVKADDSRLDVLRDQRVVSLNRAARIATTDIGTELPYEIAVIATGSRAFLPPVEGHDLPGVFLYRTIDDLDAIRKHAAGASSGVVVGGGLLGLEAADALRALNIQTHIVELAPRLMPVQIDEGGGHALLRHVRELGIAVHLEKMIKRVIAGVDGAVAGVEFASSEYLSAQIVVFAVGIRPRDELGAESSLALGERGGIMVDRWCRTEDPAVFAIGEVAAVGGRTFGLVAPGYTMSTCVVTQLLEGSHNVEPMADPDMSTKLKLLGVDVASFGDAHGVTPGSLSLAWTDQLDGVYKKLVVTDDASTVLGGVLVGDASAFSTLRALVGHPLPAPPAQLIAPTSTSDLNFSLPPTAQVCSCHAVTKGAISTAIMEEGCNDVAALKKCTKAGTGCGSCIPLLSQLLSDAGVLNSRSLCEHFVQSRAELFHIVQVSGIRRFSELIQKHGIGSGCDICKPAVASMLSSLGHGHLLDKEQRPLQDSNDKFLANLQRNGSYSVIPRIPGGEITPAKLIVIGEVARDFGLYTKITGGQRIDLLGARIEQLPAIWTRLVAAGFESGHAYGKALRTVKSCVGSTWCRYGVQDSVKLAIDLELRYRGLRAPHKIKGGVSGCARECAEARGKDFGVIATDKGWNLYLGGNGGFTPRHAQLFVSDVDFEFLVTLIDRFLMYYIRTADRLQRTAAWLESLEGGLEQLRAVIVDDSLGICADLDAAMALHVDSYSDEWSATLNDPEKLRHFVTFVNEPAESDPEIVFVTERDQPRPLIRTGPILIATPTLEAVST